MLLETEEHVVSRKQMALPVVTNSQSANPVQMVNTNLPVPPEGTTLPMFEDHSLDGYSSASGSVANKTNLHLDGRMIKSFSSYGVASCFLSPSLTEGYDP